MNPERLQYMNTSLTVELFSNFLFEVESHILINKFYITDGSTKNKK